MAEHPIQGLMKTAMESLKGMVDVGTVVGDPVETEDGQVIVPVSRVSFGFAAGGGEYGQGVGSGSQQNNENGQGGGADRQGFPFGGGSGAGVSVQPVGFLIVTRDAVRLLPVDTQSAMVDRLIDLAPQVLDRVQSMWNGRSNGAGQAGHNGNGHSDGPSIDRALEQIPGNKGRDGKSS